MMSWNLAQHAQRNVFLLSLMPYSLPATWQFKTNSRLLSFLVAKQII